MNPGNSHLHFWLPVSPPQGPGIQTHFLVYGRSCPQPLSPIVHPRNLHMHFQLFPNTPTHNGYSNSNSCIGQQLSPASEPYSAPQKLTYALVTSLTPGTRYSNSDPDIWLQSPKYTQPCSIHPHVDCSFVVCCSLTLCCRWSLRLSVIG